MIFVGNLELLMTVPHHSTQGANVPFSKEKPWAMWDGGFLFDALISAKVGPFCMDWTTLAS
jgi:hypothetical protein